MARKELVNFRKNVATLCKKHGDIQRVADRAGISRVYLSQVIHGHATPSIEIALDLADALRVSLAELFSPPKDFLQKVG